MQKYRLYDGAYSFLEPLFAGASFLASVLVLSRSKCMMWVTKEVADYVPQNCIDQFQDVCDVAVPAYDHSLCKDDDDDYEEETEARVDSDF
ncbi:hypothetical protein HPB50_025015 [Hyalomma asiaticum]|uniref:Uncharacterized protein n=1 Tax=Hyalomma asiaticum TaxID=266040 RepID=A0ACB7S2P5_HYAAI|nr:hypothetical protein HPB50_025015 [Hyalomma asiaticum]